MGLTVLQRGIKGRGVRGPEGAQSCGVLGGRAAGERLDGAAASQAFAPSVSPAGPGGGGSGPWLLLWRRKLREACPGPRDGVTRARFGRLRRPFADPAALQAAPGGGARASDAQLPGAPDQRRPRTLHAPHRAPAPSRCPTFRGSALFIVALETIDCRNRAAVGWFQQVNPFEFHLPRSLDEPKH